MNPTWLRRGLSRRAVLARLVGRLCRPRCARSPLALGSIQLPLQVPRCRFLSCVHLIVRRFLVRRILVLRVLLFLELLSMGGRSVPAHRGVRHALVPFESPLHGQLSFSTRWTGMLVVLAWSTRVGCLMAWQCFAGFLRSN